MKIVDAKWTSVVNILYIKCSCGKLFRQRADRSWAQCPDCGQTVDMLKLKTGEYDGR